MSPPTAAVIGAGPAGLMAAEVLSAAGVAVTVHERMPSVGRKLLMAGRGGLNLTHSEPFEAFAARYGAATAWLRPALDAFPPRALLGWTDRLGQETFIGGSGRVFPKALKASPLLRAWLARLADQGVEIRTRHDWLGWDAEGRLRFATPQG
ncbi:MAG: NAD(P)/FAD-dependent oxidoreductase, partial [Phenylobacterium sp.]